MFALSVLGNQGIAQTYDKDIVTPKRYRIFEPNLIEVLEQDVSPFLILFYLLFKKPLLAASSRPVAAASWSGEFVANMMRACAAKVGPIRDLGPMSQLTRHPVQANDLPAEPMVMVRSHMPGRFAMRMWGLLLKTIQSYCRLRG